MSTSKTSTPAPYGETTSDLQIGDHLHWDLADVNNRPTGHHHTVNYSKRHPATVRVSGFDNQGHVILVDPQTGARITEAMQNAG